MSKPEVDTGTPPMVAVFSFSPEEEARSALGFRLRLHVAVVESLRLAFASNIFASLTPYASAQACLSQEDV